MAQSAWHIADIGRIADTLIAVAPSEDFIAGVWALAQAVGAPVHQPKVGIVQAVIVAEHNGAGMEVNR